METLLNIALANPTLVLRFLIATFLLWFLFVNVMALIEKRKKYQKNSVMYWVLTIIGYPIGWASIVYDVYYAHTWGSLIFWQFPRTTDGKYEWTLTARLQRLVKEPVGWRGKLARFTCRYLVEPWDKGHCGQ